MTYPTQPDIPMGAASGGDAKICGDACPENYIEPNEDGSINVAIIAGDLTLSPTVTVGEGTASIGTVGLDAGSEVIGHVITDTGSLVGLEAGTQQIGHVITDPTSVTDLAEGALVGLAEGATVALADGTSVDIGTLPDVTITALPDVTLGGGTAIIGVVLPANASVGVPLGTVENAGPQVVHAGICYASGAIVTTAGGGAPLSFYNHASDASGLIVGFIPAAATAGSYWPFNMPAAQGIVAGIVDTSPAVTIAYSYTPVS